MPDPQPLRPLTDADREQAKKARDQALLNAKNEGKREGAQAEREKLSATIHSAVEANAAAMRRAHEADILRRDDRWTREEAKHAIGNRWRGRVEGVVLGGALVCVAIFAMQGVIWDTAARSFREQAMTGALLSGHREQTR